MERQTERPKTRNSKAGNGKAATRPLPSPRRRLHAIAAILESVDQRAQAVDGPVTPTLDEMNEEEIRAIYLLASGQRPIKGDDDEAVAVMQGALR